MCGIPEAEVESANTGFCVTFFVGSGVAWPPACGVDEAETAFFEVARPGVVAVFTECEFLTVIGELVQVG